MNSENIRRTLNESGYSAVKLMLGVYEKDSSIESCSNIESISMQSAYCKNHKEKDVIEEMEIAVKQCRGDV